MLRARVLKINSSYISRGNKFISHEEIKEFKEMRFAALAVVGGASSPQCAMQLSLTGVKLHKRSPRCIADWGKGGAADVF